MTESQHRALRNALELLDEAHRTERRAWGRGINTLTQREPLLAIAADARARSRALFAEAHQRAWL